MEVCMFGIEQELMDQLLLLKSKYQLKGIKAEFEAEGSSFRDLIRLRRITDKAEIKLYLKIGGVEALRDIKDSVEIGVDGLIAPMVESKFGLKKFLEAVKSVYKENKIHLSINIETKNSIEQIDDILSYARGKFQNITLGRTDLSGSYLDDTITPDSDYIINLIKMVGRKSVNNGLTFTVGGSISTKSIDKFQNNSADFKNIQCIETRKVILPRDVLLNYPEVLEEALHFEELYILSMKEINDIMVESELSRLNKLTHRVKKVFQPVA